MHDGDPSDIVFFRKMITVGPILEKHDENGLFKNNDVKTIFVSTSTTILDEQQY